MRTQALVGLIALSASVSARPVWEDQSDGTHVAVPVIGDVKAPAPAQKVVDSVPISNPTGPAVVDPSQTQSFKGKGKGVDTGDDDVDDQATGLLTAVIGKGVSSDDIKGVQFDAGACPRGYKRDDFGACVLLNVGDILNIDAQVGGGDTFRNQKDGKCDDYFYFNPVLQLCVSADTPAGDGSFHPGNQNRGSTEASRAFYGLSCSSGPVANSQPYHEPNNYYQNNDDDDNYHPHAVKAAHGAKDDHRGDDDDHFKHRGGNKNARPTPPKTCPQGQILDGLLSICVDVNVGGSGKGDGSCGDGQILNLLGICVSADINLGGGNDNNKGNKKSSKDHSCPAKQRYDPLISACVDLDLGPLKVDADVKVGGGDGSGSCGPHQTLNLLGICVDLNLGGHGNDDEDDEPPAKAFNKGNKNKAAKVPHHDDDDDEDDAPRKLKATVDDTKAKATKHITCHDGQRWDAALNICVDLAVGNILKVDADAHLL